MSLSTGFASRSFAQAGRLIGYGSDPVRATDQVRIDHQREDR
jgi:hypothetical protein